MLEELIRYLLTCCPYSLQMLYLRWYGIERGMPVDFVLGGVKQSILIHGITGVEISGSNYPDANAFVATSINVAGIFDSHLRVDRMQATGVFMGKPVLTADENFPEWPLIHKETPSASGTP